MNRKAASLITITQDRMAHNTEIISEIKRHHLRYTEVPVTILYREYGQGVIAGLKIIRDLIMRKMLK